MTQLRRKSLQEELCGVALVRKAVNNIQLSIVVEIRDAYPAQNLIDVDGPRSHEAGCRGKNWSLEGAVSVAQRHIKSGCVLRKIQIDQIGFPIPVEIAQGPG